MIEYRSFTGGIFETNCYALEAPEGWILFDAPDGACDWLVQQEIELRLLLLTHGHIDHIQDVAKIKRRFGCPVGVHPASAPMLSDREFFRNFGFRVRDRAGDARSADRSHALPRIPRDELRDPRSARSLPRQPCVFFRARTNCSSAATSSSRAGSAAGTCPAVTAICSLPASGKNSIR